MSGIRFLFLFSIFLALGWITDAVIQNVKEERNTMEEQLEKLRNDLIQAKKKAALLKKSGEVAGHSSTVEKVKEVVEDIVEEKKSAKSAKNLLEELKEAAVKESAEKKSVDLKEARTGAEPAKKKTAESAKNDAADDGGDDDDTDDDDGDSIDANDVFDEIFYVAGGLSDEIQTMCDIDIAAIYQQFSPATLDATNDVTTTLRTATKELTDLLNSPSGNFADDLKTFLDSDNYQDSAVPDQIDKTFEQIDQTMSTVNKNLFCAVAQVIDLRLKMSLYGATGFSNGFLCNSVYVEFTQYMMDATKLLKAAAEDENCIKNLTMLLVDDISCYEIELEFFNIIVPTDQFTGTDALQVAAYTFDALLGYGFILLYHRVILELEGEIIELAVLDANSNNNDVLNNKEEMEEAKEQKAAAAAVDDTESLASQLQKLLNKLNEVSAKKKAAEAALNNYSKINSWIGQGRDTYGKTSIKKSYYRGRQR